MRNSSEYESALYQLSRLLYEKPEKIKPELGPVPDFDNFNMDPLLAQMKLLSAQTAANNELDRRLSTNSVQLVEQEITKLFHMIEEKARLYNDQSEIDIRFTLERRYNESLIISSNRYSVVFNWQQVYSNSLTDSYLGVAHWAGKPTFSGNVFYFPGEGPQRLTEKQWTFDLDVSGEPVWANGSKKVKSEALVHDAFAYIIDRIRNERSKNFRK